MRKAARVCVCAWFAVAAVVTGIVLGSGCGRPPDEAWLRFKEFHNNGSTAAIATVTGSLFDGTSTSVDAVLENSSVTLDSTGAGSSTSTGTSVSTGTGLTVTNVHVDYKMSGYSPPSTDYPFSLYIAATSGESFNTGTVSGIPLASATLKDWLIKNGAYSADGSSSVNLTANVRFTAVTDEGGKVETATSIGIVLKTGAGSGSVSIRATKSSASLLSSGEFTVSRGSSSSKALTVYYTVTGSATSTEYEPLDGYVVIPAGSASATIPVEPISGFTNGHTVIVTLNKDEAGSTYTLGSNSSATVTLRETEGATVNVTATVATASTDSPGEFTVTRSGVIDNLTVDYSVSGTAKVDDYQPLDGYVIIPAGAPSATISVTTKTGYTAGRTVILTLSEGSYILGSRTKATVTLK